MTPSPLLSAGDIALVERSFRQILPISSLASELFHARLFQIAPEMQALFTGEMRSSGVAAVHWLGVAVAHLDSPVSLSAALGDLAGRLVANGVTPQHYAPVGEALLWTLEMALGEGIDAETRAAWERTYAAVSEMMVASAYPRAGRVAAE
ncbi:MAG: globin domain-containing protein [Pseudomonadota bacterium]